MKKQILLTIAIIASFFGMRAQNYFIPDEMEMLWHNGAFENTGITGDYEIVTVFVSPMCVSHGSATFQIPPVVTLSLLYDNKFLCLTFDRLRSKTTGIPYQYIDMHYIDNDFYSHTTPVGKAEGCFPHIYNLLNIGGLEFNFSDIRFYEAFKCIVIPCSYPYEPENQLLIWLDKNNSVNALPKAAGETSYYNLDGVKVNPENAEGIVIKRSGSESEKILAK